MELFSPIAFKSNVFPLKKGNSTIRMDKDFLNQIRSRKAIAVLHSQIDKRAITEWMYTPSDIQKTIYKKIVCPPAYCSLYPHTQPWGEIRVNGKEKVVCKCDQKNCPGYKFCSKDLVKGVLQPKPQNNDKQKKMEEWQKGCQKLQREIEDLRMRSNAVTPPNDHQVEKAAHIIASAEKKSADVKSWIQKLKEYDIKKAFETFNVEIQNKEKWLEQISKAETTLEKKNEELVKYKNLAQICKEFHMNWINDWNELKEKISIHLKKLPAELFVYDISEKVLALRELTLQANLLEDDHKVEETKCKLLYNKCNELLKRIQTLSEKAVNNKLFLGNLTVKNLTPTIKTVDSNNSDSQPINSFFDSFKKVNQNEFIQYSINSKIIVNAGPGTGKTYSLIERIVHLVKDEHIDADKILVLCFSRTATAEVLNRINERCNGDEILEGSNWQIGTIDSYCAHLTHSDDNQRYIAADSYEDGIRNAISVLKGGNIELTSKYVIIDEIQDIIDVRGKFILELLKHLENKCGFAVLGDFCQAIYDFQAGAKKNSFTAVQFIKELCNISDIEKLTFKHNYRSDAKTELNQKLDELRPALINEDVNDSYRRVKEIESSNLLSEDTLDDMIESVLENSLEDPEKTTGILVRRNADVTEVASKFYEKLLLSGDYLPIHIQKRKEKAYLAGWIGIFFQNYRDQYDTNYIEQDSFLEAFDSLFNNDDDRKKLNIKYPPSYYWDALEQCMADDEEYGNGRYEIEKLLEKVSLNAWKFRENCGVLLSGILQNSPIVISNVHQAKGREYDQVVLSTKILDFHNTNYDDAKTNEECRVAYVALTRTKDKIGTFKTGNWTYYKTKMTKRPYLFVKKSGHVRKIEFGRYGDIERYSFTSREIQNYILDCLPIGESLQLNKTLAGNELNYELGMDGGSIDIPDVLGRASTDFTGDLRSLMHDKELEQSVYSCYPKIIDELYVNDLVTFIERDKGQGEELVKFGDIVIWNGLSVIGMGECHY